MQRIKPNKRVLKETTFTHTGRRVGHIDHRIKAGNTTEMLTPGMAPLNFVTIDKCGKNNPRVVAAVSMPTVTAK